MAFTAAYLLHKDMFCMSVGTAEGHRALLNISKMTSLAGVPGRNPAMLLPDRPVALHNERYKHPVLLQDAHGVACLAREVAMLAHLPGLKRLLHHMTGHTELRVFSGVFVIPKAHDPSHN